MDLDLQLRPKVQASHTARGVGNYFSARSSLICELLSEPHGCTDSTVCRAKSHYDKVSLKSFLLM